MGILMAAVEKLNDMEKKTKEKQAESLKESKRQRAGSPPEE